MTTRHAKIEGPTIGNEHADLRELLARIQRALHVRHPNRSEISTLVRLLSHMIREHFSHEESGGYFADAIEVAPQLHARAEQLLREHPAILAQLVAFEESVAGGRETEPCWPSLEGMLTRFIESLAAHEAAENALLQQAHGHDIGTKD